MHNNTIIFVSNVNSTFVRRDFALLSRDYEVKYYLSKQFKGFFKHIAETFRLIGFLLRNAGSASVFFCWFADYHSFWPAIFAKIYGKPFYLVEGGYDTTYMPEFDYGVFSNSYRSFCASSAIKWATVNLPVSNFLENELIERFGKHIRTEVVPTGYDDQYFKPSKKKDYVLTIGAVDTNKRYMIKGIDRVLQVAAQMPDITFIIVGIDDQFALNLDIPNNVKLLGATDEKSIAAYFAEAKVYVQFSLREGLPNVIFEAMLSECVTVGINHTGLREAIGTYGYLLDEWDVEAAKELIQEALLDQTTGKEGRDYVIENFSNERRYKKMRSLITT